MPRAMEGSRIWFLRGRGVERRESDIRNRCRTGCEEMLEERQVGSAGRCLVGARLRGEVVADMNDVVGDHAQPDPTPDAVRSFVERPLQSMPPFENADAAFAAGAPFLKLLEPALLLP